MLLPGIGVADQADGEDVAASLDRAQLASVYCLKFTFEFIFPLADQATVDLDLLFAGAARADAADGRLAAGDAFEVGPHVPQTRVGVLQLGQFHLNPGLAALGAIGEDIEDQLGAIQHLAFRKFLNLTYLRRRQVVIEDDGG